MLRPRLAAGFRALRFVGGDAEYEAERALALFEGGDLEDNEVRLLSRRRRGDGDLEFDMLRVRLRPRP